MMDIQRRSLVFQGSSCFGSLFLINMIPDWALSLLIFGPSLERSGDTAEQNHRTATDFCTGSIARTRNDTGRANTEDAKVATLLYQVNLAHIPPSEQFSTSVVHQDDSRIVM